jgi:hypothetical protein
MFKKEKRNGVGDCASNKNKERHFLVLIQCPERETKYNNNTYLYSGH